uniref:Uncharacterized protein n=1 Tax=Anabas testudineus TaxID=64144 RepID=A0A7N6AA19_ANATE
MKTILEIYTLRFVSVTPHVLMDNGIRQITKPHEREEWPFSMNPMPHRVLYRQNCESSSVQAPSWRQDSMTDTIAHHLATR